ncbi:MAG: choline dehydrogenase [Porticoccaceae bacterium]|nr:choline dehydrogenase [Porticoccaceae bacterium]
MDTFDYVIAGGGTAASIIAYRLAEAGQSVCVLEAGPPDRNPYIRVPAGFIKTLFDPTVTWQYSYEPSPATLNRAIQVTQGKTLGGSSSVNGMVYNRGQAQDFDHWAVLGNPGWTYDDVLPYFKRTETRIGEGDDYYRGRSGPLTVSTSEWPSELVSAFVEAAQAEGHPFNPDYNGARQEGVGYYQSAIRKGRRVSTASAFLHPAVKTGRVDVRTGCQATHILFEGRRAVGIEYVRGDWTRPLSVRAGREVIVSAGALNSPKLLQLSGIGPRNLLDRYGIAVRHELTGVGENFRDHYSPRLVARGKPGVDTLNGHVSGPPLVWQILRWMAGKPSVLSLSPALVHVFGKTEACLPTPDYSLVYTPGSYKQGFIGKLDDFPGMTCGAWVMRPRSAGYVRVAGADPQLAPVANPNYLGDEDDCHRLVNALKAARSILRSPVLAPFVDDEIFPGPGVESDADLLAFAREFGVSSYHLVGSCKMGPASDPLAVVDHQLRVHGVDALRVADASIMPTMTSSNTYAPTMMIAEKAADMILQGTSTTGAG